MTPEQRDKLIDKLVEIIKTQLIDDYAWRIVDDMDIKGLCRAMAEQIAAGFEEYKDEEVIEEIKKFYPDLTD